MSRMLFDRPMETKRSPLWTTPPNPDTPICFKNLLVGSRKLGLFDPSEGQWTAFAAEVKKYFHVPVNPRPSQQRIVILRKMGRRTFLNYDELAEHLRSRFLNVEVEIMDPAAIELKEQLIRLANTTVVITPCGGVSFSAMFVPPGASAIFAEYVLAALFLRVLGTQPPSPPSHLNKKSTCPAAADHHLKLRLKAIGRLRATNLHM